MASVPGLVAERFSTCRRITHQSQTLDGQCPDAEEPVDDEST